MNSRNEIITGLRGFIIENFGFDEDIEFNNDTPFVRSGLIDSTGMLEVIAHLEKEYNVYVIDEDMRPEMIGSVDNLTDYIMEKRLTL
jgi:acyl carrier protein